MFDHPFTENADVSRGPGLVERLVMLNIYHKIKSDATLELLLLYIWGPGVLEVVGGSSVGQSQRSSLYRAIGSLRRKGYVKTHRSKVRYSPRKIKLTTKGRKFAMRFRVENSTHN